MLTDIYTPENDAYYLALKSHDARFDGSFIAAVTSTGIYCRPICRAKTPRRENLRFYHHAAEAEAAGFRPCLRCRPELAPRAASWNIEDASYILAYQAAKLMDDLDAWIGTNSESRQRSGLVAQIAKKIGITDRHLRRIFEAHLGVSPLQYLQTKRLLAAKQLIADTQLTITQVALISGFSSIRRFNDAFSKHYGLNPSAMRRARLKLGEQAVSVRLSWRPPYDVDAMLGFLKKRALMGVEQVTEQEYIRTLSIVQNTYIYAGWLGIRFEIEQARIVLTMSDLLVSVLPTLINRVRFALDLDADPVSVATKLQTAFPKSQGVRVPGSFDGFELAVRAVLGQQITVAAASTLTERLVVAFGQPIETPMAGLTHLFPTPCALVAATGDELGRLGITRQRQTALYSLAHAVLEGKIALHPGVDVEKTCTDLCALPGIGHWTAQYIALRALCWPDAFPSGDVALQKALGVNSAREAEKIAEQWKPWRGYSVLRAWHSIEHGILINVTAVSN